MRPEPFSQPNRGVMTTDNYGWTRQRFGRFVPKPSSQLIILGTSASDVLVLSINMGVSRPLIFICDGVCRVRLAVRLAGFEPPTRC
jgi:hypothetical protein